MDKNMQKQEMNKDSKDREVLLEIDNLHVHYLTDEETIRAVNGVSFKLHKGEMIGLVGETGAGKTTTAQAIMQLIPDPPGMIVDGDIYFEGKNILFNTERENRKMRGDGIAMIFQDPMTALNPTMTVLKQLVEVVHTHRKVSRSEAEKMVLDLLKLVGVSPERVNDYPHQFSGGMKQRVVIAMSLLCQPELLIADEPTTALDVTIQAQVLKMMKDLQAQFGMSMILITHDLGVVAETCERALIMYAGKIVEQGSVFDVYTHPRHPYTVGLFNSIPKLDSFDEGDLVPFPGSIPNAADLPSGCALHPRCPYAKDICKTQEPPVKGTGDHQFLCHFDIFEKTEQEGASC